MAYFSAATFRILGSGTMTQNLFTLENTTGSTKIVKIRRLSVQIDALSALTTFMPIIKTSRTTAIPTGGTVLVKVQFDTGNVASVSNVIVRAGNATDGGGGTAINALPYIAGWQQYCQRAFTTAGQILGIDNNVLSELVVDYDLVLRANEAIVVQVVAPSPTSNPTTNHYLVNCVWEEV